MSQIAARRHPLRRKRLLALGLPLLGIGFLVAIAPPMPQGPSRNALAESSGSAQAFRYISDESVHALDFDPRQVGITLLEGWDREQEAYADRSALAFVSGPMYERHLDANGHEITVPLGDIKLGSRVWRGHNRTASRQRAFVGIRQNGRADFGFGELTPERAQQYDIFIGGLHSIYNDLERPPAAYKGAYSISMGQQIRYFLPRIRMVIGLRSDGRIEVLMSKDGLTLEQTRSLARNHGLLAAYLPDHASKSRFIVPGIKDFSDEDANWISGGATSFVHVPYLLRLEKRSQPLNGTLQPGLESAAARGSCANPLHCGQTLGGQLVERSLAGLNRLMERGIEPLARLIWAPRGPSQAPDVARRSPLRETPISADPMPLRQLQEAASEPAETIPPIPPPLPPLPPDLSQPLVLEEGQPLPSEDPSESASNSLPPQPLPGETPLTTEARQIPAAAGAPAAPELPPPAAERPAAAPIPSVP